MKTSKYLLAFWTAVLCFTACDPDIIRERTIIYTVSDYSDNTFYSENVTSATVHLSTESQWQDLLDQFCDFAEDGNTVTFRNANRASKGTKETTTFSTTNREEMKRWMSRMEDQGMTVTVTYDRTTGTYYGRAYVNVQPPLSSSALLTYECDGMTSMGMIMSFDTVNHRVYCSCHYLPFITDPLYFTTTGGVYEYVPCESVNTPYAYWLIGSMGDTAGPFYLQFGNSFEVGGADTLTFDLITNHTPFTLVRTNEWQTYLCIDMGLDIVMHVCSNVYDVYPVAYCAQTGSGVLYAVDCPTPFSGGRFMMYRTVLAQSAMGSPCYGLTLDHTLFGDNYVVDGLFIQGEPCRDDQFTIIDTNCSCCSHYLFQRL